MPVKTTGGISAAATFTVIKVRKNARVNDAGIRRLFTYELTQS